MNAVSDNLPICLVRRDLAGLPEVSLSPGFTIRSVGEDEGAMWVEIVRTSERFFAVDDDLWEKQFGFDLPEALRRVYFVVSPEGSPVATIGAWYASAKWEAEKGRAWGRIHWVAVRPELQGKGIGKAMTVFALHRLAELGHTRAYLETSTGRASALRLYHALGFEPHPLTEAETVRHYRLQLAPRP